MRRLNRLAAAALCAVAWLPSPASRAAESMRVCLNWAPGADHAPLYHARQEGWFADAGLAVTLLPGGHSADALRRLAEGECEAAIADFGALLAARRQGHELVAVMALSAHAPFAFYALDDGALRTPADLVGKRIAAYASDPPRRLWRAFAARHGLPVDAVRWVDLPNNAKVDALARGEVDVAANGFYHHHLEYAAAFGSRLAVLWWRETGPDLLSNVMVLPATVLRDDAAAAFVRDARRAWLACLAQPGPCIDALVAANPHLEPAREQAKWAWAARGFAAAGEDPASLGCLDPGAVRETAAAWADAADPATSVSNTLLWRAEARCR